MDPKVCGVPPAQWCIKMFVKRLLSTGVCICLPWHDSECFTLRGVQSFLAAKGKISPVQTTALDKFIAWCALHPP